MARSLIGGLARSQDTEKNDNQIIVSDPFPEIIQKLTQDFGVRGAASNHEAVKLSDVVVLAVKPQQMHPVVNSLNGCFDGKLLISIAAGVRCTDITKWTGNNDVAVVRCMPNTPALLQCGATGLFANKSVNQTQRDSAEKILAAAGSVAWVSDESQLDAITALSGSGPAYFFLMLEAMTESAIALGLPKELATQFAIQTAVGASRMASEGDIDDRFTEIVKRAMQAANDRASELGNELGDSHG